MPQEGEESPAVTSWRDQQSPLSSGVVLIPLVITMVLGIHLASLVSLSQWGQAITSLQGVTLDPTLLGKEGRLGLPYSICFSTGKQASKENEIVVGRSDHTASLGGVK